MLHRDCRVHVTVHIELSYIHQRGLSSNGTWTIWIVPCCGLFNGCECQRVLSRVFSFGVPEHKGVNRHCLQHFHEGRAVESAAAHAPETKHTPRVIRRDMLSLLLSFLLLLLRLLLLSLLSIWWVCASSHSAEYSAADQIVPCLCWPERDLAVAARGHCPPVPSKTASWCRGVVMP